MGLIQMGPPEQLIKDLVAQYSIANFVETGTYQGGTALWAARVFEKVLTIEKSEDLHRQVIEKYGDKPNIEFACGDSREKLREAIPTLGTPTLFWLDAHWSGGPTSGEKDECPLLEEIQIVNSSPSEVYLFIDDARLFLSPPQPPHDVNQWPDISQVIQAVHSGSPDRYIVIIEDCIISVPPRAKSLVVAYCQAVNQKARNGHGRSLQTAHSGKRRRSMTRSLKDRLAW